MTEVIKKTVTAADQGDVSLGASLPIVINLFTGEFPGLVSLPATIPVAWSPYIDRILRSTIYHESMWAGAVRKSITKEVARGFTVEDSGSDRRKERAQELLLMSDAGNGWVPFAEKMLRDFILTDNGAFIEIVRASGARGSKIIGLMHLPSSRCLRTGDPDYPVIYTDLMGQQHALRDYQVLTFSDMPRSDLAYYGVGFCSAHAAYQTIYKLAGLERYFTEKVTGSRALSIKFIKGINKGTLDNAIVTAENSQHAKGYTVYMGNVLVPVPGEIELQLIDIPLADVPDGFDPETERKRADLIYANCLGIPVQDLQPLSGQGLGTGTQSVILAEESEGYGLAAWRRDWIHKINTFVFPDATTFTFANAHDLRDKKSQADIDAVMTTVITTLVEKGVITPQQAQQLAADNDLIPESMLPEDNTPELTLEDDEKPQESVPAQGMVNPSASQNQGAIGLPVQPQQAPMAIASKASPVDRVDQASNAIARLTSQLESGSITASQWYEQVMAVLQEAHSLAYQDGLPSGNAGNADIVSRAIAEQAQYLQQFADEISEADAFNPYWYTRANMYAESVKASYWRGKSSGLPIPAVPGDGSTQCLTNCKCHLEIKQLDGVDNADVYWVYGATEDHCQTCIARESEWNPLQIRDGELQ